MTVIEAIAECLSLHAECLSKLGTDHPELDPRVDPEFRDKIVRQWAKVSASLEGVDPEVHRRHVEALNKGIRIILRRLAPPPPKPAPPPLPVWDDVGKRWTVPDRDAYVDKLAKQFDERGPDSVDDLFT